MISAGKYDGIIVQPILGTGLTSLVTQAIAKKIKVVNIDQILGADYTTDKPQVAGLSANVTFIPSKIGQQMGTLAIQACKSKNLNPCNDRLHVRHQGLDAGCGHPQGLRRRHRL